MPSRRSRYLLLIAGTFTLGCSQPSEPSEARPGRRISGSPYLSGLATTGPCGGTPQDPGVDHTCNSGSAVVGVRLADGPQPQGASASLQEAVDRWNELLKQATGPGGGKELVNGSGTPVHINAVTTQGQFCGETTSGTLSLGRAARVDVWPEGHTNCVGKQTGTLETILTHEFSHVLGWDASHGGAQARSSSLTNTGCTTFLPKPEESAEISGSVCYHDVEAILRAQTGLGSMLTATYFTQRILTGTNVSQLVLEVPQGTSKGVGLTGWMAKPFGAVVRDSNSVYWSTTNPAVATVSSSGVVNGVSQGDTVKLFLKANPGYVPSGYHLWTGFRVRGDSIRVVVTPPPPPPPPPPFAVDSIWTAQQPITTPGPTTVYSAVSGAPGGTLYTRWIITDSRTPNVSDSVVVGGTTLTRSVSAGSYSLTFDVTPFIDGTASGFRGVWSVPVCTGVSLHGGSGDKSVVTPMAPQGCVPTEY